MLRTYGRVNNPDGTKSWVVVQTDAQGYDDNCYLTTLIQCLKLSIGESPFYATYGIPAQQSVVTQIFPDFYVNQIQQQFAQYFTSLIISQSPIIKGNPDPVYNISIVTNQGATLNMSVAT